MATSILSIGQTALAAAQVGISTTGHNIANAATPGYNRQIVIQGAAKPQSFGVGFLGQGAEVTSIKRVYNEYLVGQERAAQSTKSGLDSYYAQIRQIDNMLADSAAGLSPAIQDFFSGIQEMASNPGSIPARQAALSTAESLASRFQSLSGRLNEIDQGVNSQITSSVDTINAYAEQIATLNDTIGRMQRGTGQPANDLLDQRDQLILDLNKEINATVVKQDNGDYNVFIGNGQPLVVGAKTSRLATMASPSDPQKIEVAYVTNSGPVIVSASSLVGGKLGGVMAFRSQTLEPAQNALGQVAIGLASTFNEQHMAGFDLNGNPGTAFFTVAAPVVTASSGNNITSTAVIGAAISDANALTTSDYRLAYDGGTSSYTLTRLSDNTTFTPITSGQVVDGVTITLSGTPAAGDSFLIRPTANGASGFSVAITDPRQIAAAAAPGAVGDNGNALLLGALQTANTLNGGTTTYQGVYSQLVSQIGNKTRELEVTSSAAGRMLTETTVSIQNESGVNLDEEAANLLRYQQAYQAAGKVMQIASEMFDMLISLGR
jgi:flagellar hook-associated protein 1 FlgK